MENISLNWIDILIIIVYLLGIIWYGIKKGNQESSEDYFLAGRNMTWPIVGISLFAANIGSSTLIGLSSDAYNTNIGVYNYEWMAAVVLVFFAIFFLPFYLKTKVYTMPEFLERRYDSRSRYYFSFITIVGNVIIDTAAGLYAGNLILKILFPEVDSIVIIGLLALAAAAYTIPGGLSSVVHTEVIQALLLLAGSVLLTYFAFTEVGGWEGLMTGLDGLKDSGYLAKNSNEIMHLAGPANDPVMPWTGLLFGIPLLGFYFWANNQFMVQRVLSAKDLNHGRWGALFAGLLKLPVLFVMVFPGLVAIVLFHQTDISSLNYFTVSETGTSVLCTNLQNCPNMTYPVLIYNLLPAGVLGLVIAGLLAAMSSSISATLNSASTLITMDFVSKMNPNLSSKGLVRVGQIATVVLVILAASWAPQIEKFASLWEYLQMVLGFIAPPVVAVFLLGLFWKRANGNGAIASLVIGLLLAITLIVIKVYGYIPFISDMHFLHTAPLLLLVCMAIHAAVSLMTDPPKSESTDGLIWTKEIFTQETEELKSMAWYQNYRILAIILLAITATIVTYYF
ncbi:MAG: sodium:solute symporter [Reichenbachiella sp.]|uniref:sodium:solute symporter n=1 Tax=Reichenbachiella sp. TaxID=2184521 RepID=UPI003267348A